MEELERRLTFAEQITQLTRESPAFQQAWEPIKNQQDLALILMETQACMMAQALEQCLQPSTHRIEALTKLKECLIAAARAAELDKTTHAKETSA